MDSPSLLTPARRRPLGLVVAALLLNLIAGSAALAQAAPAKWTLMVYIAADNNLEPNSIINLMEMAAVGSTEDVNIVVQITRPPNYSGFYGEWGGTRRFLVTQSDRNLSSGDFEISPPRFAAYVEAIAAAGEIPDSEVNRITRGTPLDREVAALQLSVPLVDADTPLTPLQIESVEDLGDQVNSGDAATLADFGTWAVQTYPADHYGLVVWNHGGGWVMVASDDTLGPEGMRMGDVEAALQAITQTAGKRLDFIGFDACLMGQLQVALSVAPYADYEFGAEELEPGFGWDYTPLVAALTENPDITVPELGQVLVDAYDTLYRTTAKEAAQSFDLGVLDLSQVSGVIAAIDGFAAAASAAPDEFDAIATARANVQMFSNIGEEAEAADSFASVDLIDLMRLVASLSEDAALDDAAGGVIAAVQSMVVYHRASDNLPAANGLSIYYPQNKELADAYGGPRYLSEFGELFPGWQAFLDETWGLAVSTAAPITLQVASVTTTPDVPGNIHDTPVVTYNLDGKNIVDLEAQIVFRVDDGISVVLDQFPVTSEVTTDDGSKVNDFADGISVNDFYWNARVPVLSDGESSELVLMTSNDKDPQHGFIRGTYTNGRSGEASDGYLSVDFDTYESSGVWAISGANPGAPIAQVTTRPGDTFEPSHLVADDQGNTAFAPSGSVMRFGKGPLTVSDEPGPDGQYQLVLRAIDASGADSVDVAELDIANDGLDVSLQGFKDLNFGLSFLYPADWTDVSVYQRADGLDELYVSDIDEEAFLSAVDFNEVASLDEMVGKLRAEVADIAGDNVGELADEVVGAYHGVSLGYSYTDGDGTALDGLAVVVFVAETGQGYLLKIEAPPEKVEAATEVIRGVFQTAYYFAPPAE